MTISQWSHILTQAEIDAASALTAQIDPSFSKRERDFYSSRSASQLRALIVEAWNCSEPTSYQMARSYLALIGGDE